MEELALDFRSKSWKYVNLLTGDQGDMEIVSR